MVEKAPDTDPTASWLEILEESEADLAAGRIVSGEEVLRGLREALARIEAQIAARTKLEAKPQR
jgi:hypothetical protein